MAWKPRKWSLKEQYSEAVSHYGPTYPKALAVQDQLKDLDALIVRERKRAVENIRSEYQAAVEREKALSDAVAKQNTEVEKVNQLLIEHNLLKREFESNQQLYDSLLTHLKDANVSAGLRATNIHVIDRGSAPDGSHPAGQDPQHRVCPGGRFGIGNRPGLDPGGAGQFHQERPGDREAHRPSHPGHCSHRP